MNISTQARGAIIPPVTRGNEASPDCAGLTKTPLVTGALPLGDQLFYYIAVHVGESEVAALKAIC